MLLSAESCGEALGCKSRARQAPQAGPMIPAHARLSGDPVRRAGTVVPARRRDETNRGSSSHHSALGATGPETNLTISPSLSNDCPRGSAPRDDPVRIPIGHAGKGPPRRHDGDRPCRRRAVPDARNGRTERAGRSHRRVAGRAVVVAEDGADPGQRSRHGAPCQAQWRAHERTHRPGNRSALRCSGPEAGCRAVTGLVATTC